MGLKKVQEQEYARVLYLNENLSQKEIAEKVGITEKTLGKWIEQNDWKKLKKSLLNTRKNNINLLYDQLENKNLHIATRKPVYASPDNLIEKRKTIDGEGNLVEKYVKVEEKDYPLLLGNSANSAEADAILKLSAAINKLEFETGIGEMVQVGMEFIDFVRQVDFTQVKLMSALFDQFIQTKIR